MTRWAFKIVNHSAGIAFKLNQEYCHAKNTDRNGVHTVELDSFEGKKLVYFKIFDHVHASNTLAFPSSLAHNTWAQFLNC